MSADWLAEIERRWSPEVDGDITDVDIEWLFEEVKRLRTALGAHIQVIGATHANGYGHSNPWDHCDMPICRMARDQRTSESAQQQRPTD